ncbi:hypothetical protein BDZ97DRAFT_1808515 [Flammula alnicola]|nr:hypothetical protein BDZ97DRAFT_1808515 [Flammula alnicola]
MCTGRAISRACWRMSWSVMLRPCTDQASRDLTISNSTWGILKVWKGVLASSQMKRVMDSR